MRGDAPRNIVGRTRVGCPAVKNPFLKFFTTDWRSDPKLRMCSLAARGLWIEMICLMHEADPYGHLTINGASPTEHQLAALIGAPPAQIPELIGELEAAGVFSKARGGAIYSRKLTAMARKTATARKNGQSGGNPTLCKDSDNPALVNPKDKAGDKPQKLEARREEEGQKKKEDTQADACDADGVDFAKAIFENGVRFLKRHGVSERQARSVIGKWRKDHSDRDIFESFAAAAKAGITEPVAWITKRMGTPPPKTVDLDAIWDGMEKRF